MPWAHFSNCILVSFLVCLPNASARQATNKQHLIRSGKTYMVDSRGGVDTWSWAKSIAQAPHATVDECHASLGQFKQGLPAKADVAKRFELLATRHEGKEQHIVEIGGNIGEDLGEFARRFPTAKIHTYEPVEKMFKILQRRFGNNSQITIKNYGASDANQTADFVLSTEDRTGHFGESTSGVDKDLHGTHVQVELKDINVILNGIQGEGVVDAMSINCEGCEYVVLKRMAETGWIGRLPFLQMSWHLVDIPNRVDTRCKIEQALRQSYNLAWYSDYGWQGWKLRA